MSDHTPANTRGIAPATTNPTGLIWHTCPECGVTLEVWAGFDVMCKGTTENPKHSLTLTHGHVGKPVVR